MAQAMKMDMAQAADAQTNVQIIYGSDLNFQDRQAWKFYGEIAEFMGGNPNNGHGCDPTKLQTGTTYDVSYYVSMKNHQVTGPVKLGLEFPDGTIKMKTETITLKPDEWKPVSVGTFQNRFTCGEVYFTFSAEAGDTWKGLLIKCVIVATPPPRC